jgi:hypothetical protein
MNTNTYLSNSVQGSETELYDEAAEERQFILDDTEGDDDEVGTYDPEALPPFKIVSAYTNDTIPKTNGCNPKVKYAKRRIVFNDATTTVTLRGYGFGPRQDSSTLEALIKKVPHKVPTVLSWSDTLVRFTYPAFDSATLKTFSIQFKIHKRFTYLNKPKLQSKSKAMSSINSLFRTDSLCSAGTVTGSAMDVRDVHLEKVIDSVLAYRQSFGLWLPNLSVWSSPNAEFIESNVVIQKGDIMVRELIDPDFRQFYVYGIALENQRSNGQVMIWTFPNGAKKGGTLRTIINDPTSQSGLKKTDNFPYTYSWTGESLYFDRYKR